MEPNRFPHVRVGVLGIITIAVYGSWYYAFGVLLDPMIADTGWSEAVLASAFGASLLLGGIGSLLGGLLLDRLGSRLVFGTAAIVGFAAFQTAARTDSLAVFAVAGAVGGGTFAGLGFYHITQTTAVRISPGDSAKAIAVLTIWGAFASAIYIPVAAWLVTEIGWRSTLSVLTLTASVALMTGSVMIDARVQSPLSAMAVLGDLRASLRDPHARRFVTVIALVGMGVSTVLVYQVPAMTAAGLAPVTASFWAGFRGFAQLGGRLPLMPIVRRLGTTNSLRLAIASISVGMAILSIAGSVPLAIAYALIAGFGIGALSPLQGMMTSEVFGSNSLGTAMGLLTFVFLVAGSIGPAIAGIAASASGSRSLPVVGGAVLVMAAAVLMRADAGQALE